MRISEVITMPCTRFAAAPTRSELERVAAGRLEEIEVGKRDAT